jgi:flagellar biosynthesis/type III secretory pathway M-ring protein FliF/YscJ
MDRSGSAWQQPTDEHVKATSEDMESEIEAELQASSETATRRLPVLTRRVATLSEKEPENTARLLRAWLTEGER